MSRWTLSLIAAFGIVIGAVAMFWYVASFGTPGSVGETARTERVVRAYLLAHPEIIPEAMQKLQERETVDREQSAAKVALANRVAIETPFAGAWAGSADPDVTVVEYFDYNCGYCRASLPAIGQLLKSDPKVRIVYRDFPILDPKTSFDAARMSLAAAEQGKFQRYHDTLYAAGPVSAETIVAAAHAAGVDPARAAAFRPRADAEIAANEAMARKLGLTGTPSWVVGSKVVSSALPLEELQRAVAEARAAK